MKYTFDWGDGTFSQTFSVNSGSAGSAYHRWSKAGTYLVRAMATDSKGSSSAYSNALKVVMINNPPSMPSIPSGPASGNSGTVYSYSASATDPDGDQVKYKFDWGDGTVSQTALVNSGTSASAYHSWSGSGTYLVKAAAIDSKGASSGYSAALYVIITTNKAPNMPSIPSGPASGVPGTVYSYSASATDPDGDKVQYKFDWGDATASQTALVNSGTSASASHSWSASGTYLVRAMAMDSKGASSGYSDVLSVVIAPNKAPNTPSIPSGPSSGSPGTVYSYSASATDPDGDQVRYIFSWGDGTTSQTALVNSGTSASASHSWSASGTYLVKAMAMDSKGASSGYSAVLQVIITTNKAPNTPSIPSGPSSGVPGTVYSYSTAATDPDGDQVRYIFSWGDGTASQTALVNSGTTASASHSWSGSGTYLVRAMAMDSKGASSGYSDVLSVVIALNKAPNTPSIPSGPVSGVPGTVYSYSTAATDPDGDQVKYLFSWGDGTASQTSLVNSGTSASASHSWSASGTYLVKAAAMDSKGAPSGYSAVLSVDITTDKAPNTPSIPSGPTSGVPGTVYSYSTAATDPNGDKVQYKFDWGDGTTSQTALVNSGTTASASHSWSASGTYPVRAMAIDSKGASSGYSDILSVVIAPNKAPNTPSIPAGPASGVPGTVYSYSTAATDPDGDQVSYIFNWGDGTTSQTAPVNSGTSASASHSWSTSGTYLVRAMAIDSKGASSGYSDILSVAITSNKAPNTPSAPSGWTSGFTGTSYKYFALTTDPDGDQVRYTFDWGDGTVSQTVLVNSGSAGGAYHSWSKAGTYLVRAMATDSQGASSGYSQDRTVIITKLMVSSSPSMVLKDEEGLKPEKVDVKELKLLIHLQKEELMEKIKLKRDSINDMRSMLRRSASD